MNCVVLFDDDKEISGQGSYETDDVYDAQCVATDIVYSEMNKNRLPIVAVQFVRFNDGIRQWERHDQAERSGWLRSSVRIVVDDDDDNYVGSWLAMVLPVPAFGSNILDEVKR